MKANGGGVNPIVLMLEKTMSMGFKCMKKE